jgi:eukaryotic-like serine/threonine-protein kinase
MSAQIQVTIVGGTLPVQHRLFTDPETCVIGRAPDCEIALPATLEYCDVSRRHCALKIDPPFVHVRDLGSLNGTYINNDRVGGRSKDSSSRPIEDESETEWFPLHDGDELRLGQHAILLVDVRDFVAEDNEAHSPDKVGSGTYDACPD